jgi:predicted lipid carrier protein YhbT
MKGQGRSDIPILPAVAASFLARLVPPMLMRPAFAFVMGVMRWRHPGVFGRLGPAAGALVVIEPTDLPVSFALELRPAGPVLRLATNRDRGQATATVRGPLAILIALVEGRVDGDALFFSRELAIAGDTEPVVALRNALDGEEIDLIEDILAPLGPLSGPAARALRGAGRAVAGPLAELDRLAAGLLSSTRPPPHGSGPR